MNLRISVVANDNIIGLLHLNALQYVYVIYIIEYQSHGASESAHHNYKFSVQFSFPVIHLPGNFTHFAGGSTSIMTSLIDVKKIQNGRRLKAIAEILAEKLSSVANG